jgi:hypothetical protein
MNPVPHWQLADQVMRSEPGKQALREGWARQLYRLVLQHGATVAPPVTQDDIDQLAFASRADADFFSRVAQTPEHPLREPLLAFWKAEMNLERSLSEHYTAIARRKSSMSKE